MIIHAALWVLEARAACCFSVCYWSLDRRRAGKKLGDGVPKVV